MGKLLELVTTNPKLRYKYSDITALLPTQYRDKITVNEARNRTTGNQLLRWCLTQATHFFDPATAHVLQFIITRTYLYAKEGELIAVSQFVSGVFSGEDGRSVAAPAVKDKATVYKALSILEQVGAIDRVRVTVNSADVISLLCVNAESILSMNMTREQAEMLRASRKQKQTEQLENDEETGELEVKTASSRVGGFPPTRVGGFSDTEYIKNNEDIKKNSCSVPRNIKRVKRTREKIEIGCNTSAEESVAKAVARVTRIREDKAQRGARADLPQQSSLVAMFQTAWIARYGFAISVTMTGKEYGIFRRIAKAHSAQGQWRELIGWAVGNWERLNAEHRKSQEYKKKKGEWSMEERDKLFMGSDRPDLYCFVMNYVKILRRFTEYKLRGVSISVDTEEASKLRDELATSRREARALRTSLSRVLSGKELAAKEDRPARRTRVVDPAKDTFFDEEDAELPAWREA